MLKLKLKWHLIWCRIHFHNGMADFEAKNHLGSALHNEKFLAHGQRYISLGGKAEDVFGGL